MPYLRLVAALGILLASDGVCAGGIHSYAVITSPSW
jgi:hypothetical protein